MQLGAFSVPVGRMEGCVNTLQAITALRLCQHTVVHSVCVCVLRLGLHSKISIKIHNRKMSKYTNTYPSPNLDVEVVEVTEAPS